MDQTHAVGIDRRGRGAAAVTAHIHRDGAVAAFRQGRQLMAPRVPGFGKAVHQEHERAMALLGNADVYAVGAERSEVCLCYCVSFSPVAGAGDYRRGEAGT